MAQESLLKKLDEAASKARLLEGEMNEAIARVQALEHETDELKNLISVAESKVDEMLKGDSAPEMSRNPATEKTQVTNVPLASRGLEELVEASGSQEEKRKRRSPRGFGSD